MPDLLVAVDVRAGVLRDVANERIRQVTREGYNEDHDDEENSHRELAHAAACYALQGTSNVRTGTNGQHNDEGYAVPHIWPERWDTKHWKPKDERSNLIRAAALLVAEIERLDRERLRATLGEAIKRAGF